MFSVERGDCGKGWRVRLSWPGTGTRAKTVELRTFAEVKLALAHFHGEPHGKRNCPFCK